MGAWKMRAAVATLVGSFLSVTGCGLTAGSRSLGVTPSTRAVSRSNATEAAPSTKAGLVVTGIGWTTSGLTGSVPASGSCHYRTALDGFALPDPTCTPGAVDAGVTQTSIGSTICRPGYSSSVRPPESLTEPAKFRAMAAYGAQGPASVYEFDHLVPLELGGSSDLRNLWPEPEAGSPSQFDRTDTFGQNAKDGVENRLHAAVCSGQVPLVAAQAAIASDWTRAEGRLGIGP
jgi:hypothetical protein